MWIGSQLMQAGYSGQKIFTTKPFIREMAYQSLVRPIMGYALDTCDPHSKGKTHETAMVDKHEAQCWTFSDYV